MKKLTVLMFAVLLLTGCEEYKGYLNLNQTIELKVDDKNFTIPAGERPATLKRNSKKKIKLHVNVDGEGHKVSFKVPKDFEVPEEGEFFLPSDITQQPVDLAGLVSTSQTQTEEHSSVESCSYSVREYFCRRYKGNTYRCWCEYRSYYDGDRRVRYYYNIKESGLQIDLLQPGSENSYGSFDGRAEEKEKVYTYQSTCFQKRQDNWRCY